MMQSRFESCIRTLPPIGLAACLGLLVSVVGLLTPAVSRADDHYPYESDHPCAGSIGPIGSCTANDIDIADASEAIPADGVTFCLAGQPVEIMRIDVDYELNAAQRYDPLIWVGLNGNDPRDDGPDHCYVSSVPPEEAGLIFDYLDLDSCLDVEAVALDTVSYQDFADDGSENLSVLCQDADDDGFADLPVIVSWQQNTNQDCGNVPPEEFGLGAPSKCNYSLISLNIPYVSTSLSVAKQIMSDFGGAATLDDFDVSVDGMEVAWADSSSTTGGIELVKTSAGTYTLSEADVEGYTEGTWACVDQDDQEVPVTNGGHFSGADVTVEQGRRVTCSIVNTEDAPLPPPELTLLKSVTNDNGGDALPGDFQLRLDGGIYDNAPFSSGDSPPVEAGPAYTLSEDPFPGYDNLGVTCFDEGAEEVVPHPVTLAPGQVVTCTIGNDDIAPALTLLKSVVNDDGGEAEPGDFTLRLNGGIYSDAPFTSGDSPPVEANTAYALSEDPFPGYQNLGVSCFDEGAEEVVPHPVTLAPGQVVTCTLTNDDVGDDPQLFLVKSVTNDNGGGAAPGDFQLRLDGGDYDNAPFTSGDSPPVEAGTPYTLSEDVLPGYDNLGVTCFDEGAEEVVPHPVTLSEGQVVTCTIANDDIPPELTIILEVISDDGGTAVPGDWTIMVTADNPSADDFPGAGAPGTTITVDAGAYSVVATGGPGGYELTPSGDCAGDLEVGESAVCTITADDIQPSLTITKDILLNDDGPATLGDFDIRVDDVPVAWTNPDSTSGGSELVATFAKTYTLSETLLDDYDEGTWSCTDADGEVPVTNGGDPTGADVTVMPGQDVDCGIINRFVSEIDQSLTVRKIIVSDHGGTATLADFEVAVGGEEVAWSNPASPTGGTELVTGDAGTYTLSEGLVDGYEPGTWACSDLDGPVPVTNGGAFDGADVTVEPGQHVLCSITNDDLLTVEQSLTVTKIIVSDNGGTATVADFEVSVDGVEVDWTYPDSATGGTETVRDLPGTYRLSEADVEGYAEGEWICSDEYGDVPVTNGGLFSGADVVVALGQHVHCSITNDDEFVPEPGLVVVKVIRSVNGGTATLEDFEISVNGFEVDWEDPGSVTGGSRFVSGKPGTYTLSEADLEGYMEGRWSCTDEKYRTVPVSNDGHFSGADVVVEFEQQVTCTITNNDLKPQPDLSVTKRTDPDIGECGVIIGQHLDFTIEAANAGPGPAEGVILEDRWSWQLKLSRAPDMIECSDPVERSIRCKLGNMEPGTSKEISLGFMVGGNAGEEACNLATVSAYPDDYGDPADNEAEVCFDLVGKLMLETGTGCGDLPTAFAGEPYDESIGISGGEPPYEAEFEGLPDGFSGTVTGAEVRIQGCSTETSAGEFTIALADGNGCQDTRDAPAVCTLVVVEPPDCLLGDLVPSSIPPAGVSTPDPDVLPDESAQKIVVDSNRDRYLVGFAYRDHAYSADPNGSYVHHARNYDIRVVKYDDDGLLLWDKTYDTGNHDFGYAISLSPDEDRPGLFVGGGALVETGPHAWQEAVLLEIDPDTGCPAGQHFQSAGRGTTSAFYDVATDGVTLYAVGERQRNEQLVGDFGALVSIYRNSAFAGAAAPCEGDHHIIGYPPPAGPDPAVIRTLVREGGLVPTVAYSVQLPPPGCDDCPVLVGGRSEAGGWVDRLDTDNPALEAWLTPGLLGDFSVQDMAVTGDRVVVVGASSENDMHVMGYDRAGSALWAPKDLGKGRLRGVALDEYGAFYVVGRSDDDSSEGLIFKFDASGDEIDRDQLARGTGASFTDVAVFAPGRGVIAGRNDESQDDYAWFQVEFECDLDCPDAGD